MSHWNTFSENISSQQNIQSMCVMVNELCLSRIRWSMNSMKESMPVPSLEDSLQNKDSHTANVIPLQPLRQSTPPQQEQQHFENLKIGDIIYLNYQTKITLEQEEDSKGVVVGDGIASDKLLCVPKEILCKSNGTLNFRKSLFQIENSKKYSAQQELQKSMKEWKEQESQGEQQARQMLEQMVEEDKEIKAKQSIHKIREETTLRKEAWQRKVEELKAKVQLEIKDQEEEYENSRGEEVTYGQEVQLRHVYSKCVLTLRKEELAEQNGCVKVTLEESGGEGSNFRFVPANNLQIQGQTIQYTDKVILSSGGEKDDVTYLHIADDLGGPAVANRKASQKSLFEKGLEVNGSEVPTKLKVNCYVNHEAVQQQSGLQEKYLQNGDLVYLQSKELEGNLGVQYQELRHYRSVVPLHLQDSNGLSHQTQMQRIDQQQMADSQVTLKIYVEQDQKGTKQQVNCIWEVQQKETFSGAMGKDTDWFKLKNLSTGLFLQVVNKDRLCLTMDGKQQDCLFRFKLKKQYSLQDQYVPLEESLNLKTQAGEFISVRVQRKDTYDNLMANYQQLKQVEGMHLRDYSQMTVCVSRKNLHQHSLLFQLTRVDPALKVIADRICSLHPQLASFLFFLQTYGIRKDKQGRLSYDYKTALAMERDLETELQQLQQSLHNLADFLDPSRAQNQDKSFKLKQYSLKDMQILDLLIQIAKSIDTLIDGSEKSTDLKMSLRRPGGGVSDQPNQPSHFQDNTPQYLANLHLNTGGTSVLKQIYDIVGKMIRNNRKNSEYLLKGELVAFLVGQVKSEASVEKILKEAVFMARDCPELRLDEWMHLLEPLPNISVETYYPLKPRQVQQISVEQAAHQIHHDQLFCLQIITNSLLDHRSRPLKEHQDLVRKHLSRQNSPLLHFVYHMDTPTVMFQLSSCHPHQQISFYKLNKALESVAQPDGQVLLGLDSLSAPSLSIYVKYIGAYLNLLADLCLGRNQKSIQYVSSVGLTSTFLTAALKCQSLSSVVKHALTKLLLNVYLDLDPLQTLSSFKNRNIIYEDIPAISPEAPSFQLIGHKFFLNLQQHQSKLIDDFTRCKLYYWDTCWQDGFSCVDCDDLLHGNYDHEVQNEMTLEKIKAFIGLLQFTKQVIDLGFTNEAENMVVLKKIKTLMRFQTQRIATKKKKKKLERNWVSRFLIQLQKLLISKKYSQEKADIEEEQYLVSVIYEEAIDILGVISRIKQIRQYYEFLKIAHDNGMGDMSKMFNGLRKVYKKDDSIYKSIFKMLVDPEVYQAHDLKSLVITPRLSIKIYQAINKYCEQSEDLAKEILNIVLINSPPEIQFYRQFGGFAVDSMHTGDIILNPMNVLSLVKKLKWENIRCQTRTQSMSKQELKRTTTISQLNTILSESVKQIKAIFPQKLLFKTCQEMLRNLDIHNIVVQIIKIPYYEQGAYRELFIKVIKFLQLFALDNPINQQELLKDFYCLIRLIYNNLSIKKLLGIMLTQVKESTKSGKYIEDIMQLLSWNAIIRNEYNCNQLLSILLSLTRDRHKRPLRHNQQRILTKLLKIQQLMAFKECQDSVEYIQSTKREISQAKHQLGFQSYESQLHLMDYDYDSLIRMMNRVKGSELFNRLESHLNTIGIIANCVDGYSLGIQSVRKIISKDQLNSYLVSAEIPFKCKKPYLRLYHEVIMKQMEGLAHINEFQLYDMQHLLQMVVLPDLEVFIQYLDGIIPIEVQEKTKLQKALKMRHKIKDNKNSFGLQLVKSKQQAVVIQGTDHKIIFDSKEYWDYLSGGDIFDNSHDGLLHFLFDCLEQMRVRQYWPQVSKSVPLLNLFRALRDIVHNITNSLKRIEKECESQFPRMNLLLKSILKLLEQTGDLGRQKQELEEEQFIEEEEVEEERQDDQVLETLRLSIIRSRLSTDQFCRNLHQGNNVVSLEKYHHDLNQVLQCFEASQEVSLEAVRQHVMNLEVALEKGGRTLVLLTALRTRLKASLEENLTAKHKDELVKHNKTVMAKAYQEYQQEENTNEIDLRLEKYKLMLLEYFTFGKDKEQKVCLLVNQLDGLTLEKKCQQLKHLMGLFGKNGQRLHLLRILRCSLNQDLEKSNDCSGVQLEYHRAGTTILALGMLKQGNQEKVVYQAIQILNALLQNGNSIIQEDILAFFKTNEHNVQFQVFNYLKSHINAFKLLIQQGKLRKNPGGQLRSIAIDSPGKFYRRRSKVGSQIIIKEVLLFLQLLCENCNNNLQNYLGNQSIVGQQTDNLANINIVQETADLLSSMKYNFAVQKTFFSKSSIEQQQFLEFSPEKGIVMCMESESELQIEFNDILNQCFKTLTDFCVGPCNKNQDQLCADRKLILYINQHILQKDRKFELEKFQNALNRSDIEVLSSCVKYLLIITIGNTSPINMHSIISHLKVKLMIDNMHQIYVQTIRPRENHIVSEKEDFLWQYVQADPSQRTQLRKYLTDIIQLGFDLYIIFQFFMDISNDEVFEYIKCDQSVLYNPQQKLEKEQNRDREITQMEQQYYQAMRQQGEEEQNEARDDSSAYQREEIDQRIQVLNQDYQVFRRKMKDHEAYSASCQFYRQFVGSVEIAKEGDGERQLYKLYFQKEFTSKFITKNIKYNIIYEVNRQSDQERISHFLKNIDNYKKEMLYRQKISKFNPVLNFFVHSWRFFKDVSFLLVLVINILLVCTVQRDEQSNQVVQIDFQYLNQIYTIVSIIQMVLSVTVYINCMVERLRISLARSLTDSSDLRGNHAQFASQSLLHRFRVWFSNDGSQSDHPQSLFLIVLKILLDSENLQNLLYLAVTALAWFNKMFYCFLLLDVVRRSEDLQNILKSLRMNYSSLGKTSFLGLVVIYLFSVFGFLSLKDYYVEGENGNNYATKLYLAFTSTINNGLRAGGGIGDSLTQVKRSSPDYWRMWVFQLLFFLVVNLLLINIIFGIIIDTYGELREKTREYLTEVKEKCYICGLSNQQFDNQGNGWLQHIYLEHNLYNYLHFIIYIKHKESQDCNGLEKYVKDQITNDHHSFIPILQALSLNK